MSEIIRGLEIPSVVAADAFDVEARTNLSVDTFESLGMVRDRGAAREQIGQSMQSLNDRLVAQPVEAATEPFLAVELSPQFSLNALVTAFDAKQAQATYFYEALWSQYSPAELNTRYMGECVAATSGNGVSGMARAMLLGGDHEAEQGLYFTNKNLSEQVEAVGRQGVVNPADYIMLNAQRREAGEQLLDAQTYTRFIQLQRKSSGGFSWVPNAGSDGGQLWLYGSGDFARPSVGVRLSVGLEA